MKKAFVLCLLVVVPGALVSAQSHTAILLDDDFSALRPGMFSAGVVGAHMEYHYLPASLGQGNWQVSCFKSVASQRAWRVIREGSDAMMAAMFPTTSAPQHTHPMIVAGDPLWQDYRLRVRFAPSAGGLQSGLVFRYRNDRCYYFFGVQGDRALLKRVQHAQAFHKPDERILAEEPYDREPDAFIEATVTVQGARIHAAFAGGPALEAEDRTFAQGKIGLTCDVPTRYSHVQVTATSVEQQRIAAAVARREREEARLQEDNPRMVVWRKADTEGFGMGRNIRFGDLDGDGEMDVLIGQVLHHGPKDRNSELSCLTAMNLKGKVLWQIGQPDPWKDHLTNDVGFQIHDLDGDGGQEVIYCKDQRIVVADGRTGRTKYDAPTPQTPAGDHGPHNIFPHILGDSLYFCDLRGTGRDSDIIIKDRYRLLWALNDKLEIMWTGACVTGHYPFAYDIDGDGRDELSMGYTLFDHDGKKLWSLDGVVKDHADGVAIARFKAGAELHLLCAASDEGMFFADMKGNILKHHFLGHVQNPAIANFRDDLPGLEAVSINFWGNQGIIHYFDADGDLYHDFEPCAHGSMCLPINWSGKSEEYYVLSPNVSEGGLFDGWGRRVVTFPADGHPELCNAVMDITGDCRDEIVVWDAYEMWIYTQDDNPRGGKLYRPKRNPQYNNSNYQATVSLPGWSENP
jgi:hypothetical protein